MKVPVEDEAVELTANVDVAGVPEVGVIGLVIVTVASVGADPTHEYVSKTGELKLFKDETVTVELAVAPTCIVTDVGVRVIVKSAFDGTVRAKA